MNIGDILPLIIIGLIYLFGSSSRKKKEMEQKEASKARSKPNLGAGDREEGESLRARLDKAIAEMYDDVREESHSSNRADSMSKASSSAGQRTAGPQIAARTRADRDQEQAADIDAMVAKTMYDREEVDSTPSRPAQAAAATDDQYSFHSQFDEVPDETYHGHGFGGFSGAHGIHHMDAAGKTHYADDSNFREFSSLYPTLRHGGSRRHAEEPGKKRPRKPFFKDRADLRRAIVAAEILGPPVALRRHRRNPLP